MGVYRYLGRGRGRKDEYERVGEGHEEVNSNAA